MKATHLPWLALLGACVGFSPLTAAAAGKTDGPKPAALFQSLDKNKDGKIVADEIGDERAKFFKRLIRVGDSDKDGSLSKDEFLAATKQEPKPKAAPGGKKGKGGKGRPNPKKMFKRLDKNEDGKVTKDEIPEPMQKRFNRIFEKLGKEELTQEDFVKFAKTGPKGKGKGPSGKRGPGHHPKPEELFKKHDANKDGKLSLAEVPEKFKPRFERLLERAGKDSDGSVNLKEFKRVAHRPSDKGDRPRRGSREGGGPREGREGRGPHRPPAFFTKLDTNKDHKLSKEELSKAADVLMELDKNKDGQLDPPELFGHREGRGRRGGFGRGPEGEGRGPRGEGRGPEGKGRRGRRGPDGNDGPRRRDGQRGPGGKEFFKRFDKDNDGKISKEEAPERMKNHFDKIDANSDGSIDEQELKQAHERRRKSRGKRGKGDRKGPPKNKDT